MMTFTPESQIEVVIERLKDAVFANYKAIDNPDEGYAYASGYSRSAMQGAIEDLTRVIEQIKDGIN